jgi:two-component system LytT family response regulator
LRRAIAYVEFAKSDKTKTYPSTFAVKNGSRTDLIPLQDICYFQAEGTYVQVVTDAKTYLVPEAIYELETMLNPQLFLRIHRSAIVNTAYVKSIHSLLNGDHQLLLKNGKELRASRTYRDAIKRLQNSNRL